MANRTLGTKSKGPVKPGNYGYGYLIEKDYSYQEEYEFDNREEETQQYDSCYNCVRASGFRCTKYNMPIRAIGSTKYRHCESYEHMLDFRKRIDKTNKPKQEPVGPKSNKIEFKINKLLDEAKSDLGGRTIMTLLFLCLKLKRTPYRFFYDLNKSLHKYAKQTADKYQYSDKLPTIHAKQLILSNASSILNTIDILSFHFTHDDKSQLIYNFIRQLNIIKIPESDTRFFYYIHVNDSSLNTTYFCQYDEKKDVAQFGVYIPFEYFNLHQAGKYNLKKYNIIYSETKGKLYDDFINY